MSGAHGSGEREDIKMNCQVKNSKHSHSNPETAPEMFIVRDPRKPGTERTECLAHAMLAEARGHQTEIVLT